jgi:membrane-bound ClpP family serine protease
VGKALTAGRLGAGTPVFLPVVGAITCLYLVLSFASGRRGGQYWIAIVLLAIGIVLSGAERLYTAGAVLAITSVRWLASLPPGC